nr:hypothetical protein [Clostridiales bacterium]
MNLKYILPPGIENQLGLSEGERIYYSVPFDVDSNGNWTDDSFIAVTTEKIHVIKGGDITSYNIRDL